MCIKKFTGCVAGRARVLSCAIILSLCIISLPARGSPLHSVTVDVGPTIYGFMFSGMGDMLYDDNVTLSGFGIAAQYEHQLDPYMSAAGRGSYFGIGMGITDSYSDDDGRGAASLDMSMFALCFEGHFRFYPSGKAFFLDGMAGYGNMTTSFKGAVSVHDYTSGYTYESVSMTASRNFLKFGAKLGWRISSASGGFTFEPSLGYDFAVSMGSKSVSRQFVESITGELEDPEFDSELDIIFGLLEHFFFIGGPRISLSFGWRF